MVVPLQTLPGWPVAPEVTWLHAIGLLIGLPVAAIIIITVIGKVGHRIHLNNGGNTYDEDPATREGRALGSEGGGSNAKALPADQSGETFQAGAEADADADAQQAQPAEAGKVGGARARW